MSTHVFLSGNFAPVHEERTETELAVTGHIPEALAGRLLRIGSNPVAPEPDPASYHWFLGNGMVHGVRLGGGRAHWYRSRFVRDDHLVEARGWPPVAGPAAPLQLFGGIVNTNVIEHAGRTYALVEGGSLPVELTGELETVARSDFGGTLPGGFTAHPKRDPDSGELYAAVYSPLAQQIQVVVVGVDGRVRRTVDVPVPGSPMVHDCAITERFFVLLDLPVVVDAGLAEAGRALPYAWTPEYGARVGLLPREGEASDVVWSEVDPCYVFHPMNAYDDADGRVVLDVVRHPSMFAADIEGPDESTPSLDRWVVDPSGGPVKTSRLDDRPQEFPRVDERRVGRPYRYGYSVLTMPGFQLAGLLKHDLASGTSELRAGSPERQFMEPVFVPRHAAAEEDDGWVLAYTYEEASKTSDVLILDARDFAGEPVATVHLPARVPFGFHGNWLPDGA